MVTALSDKIGRPRKTRASATVTEIGLSVRCYGNKERFYNFAYFYETQFILTNCKQSQRRLVTTLKTILQS